MAHCKACTPQTANHTLSVPWSVFLSMHVFVFTHVETAVIYWVHLVCVNAWAKRLKRINVGSKLAKNIC